MVSVDSIVQNIFQVPFFLHLQLNYNCMAVSNRKTRRQILMFSLTFHYVTKQLKNVYFLKSRTNTVPSLAEAPTLSPRLFQQTLKMTPVPF